MSRIAGRTAVVTGAAGGLGQAFCVGLAEAGAATVVGVDLADQERVRGAVETTGARYVAVTADVTSEADCAALAEQVAEVGPAGILVNNAGIFPSIPFLQTSLEDWRRIHRLNVEGTFLVTRALLPAMVGAGWGRVVMVASAVVWLGPPNMVAYTASKGALVAMVRSLATEVGHTGVTVNAMTPGLTRTETALTSAVKDDFPRVVESQAVPRAEEPEDLVSTLLFLCDEGSGFVTGSSVNVDGGFAKH